MGIKKVLHIATLLLSFTLSAQSVVEHTVEKGNTLYSLSKQYGVSIEAIQEANPELQGTALSLGQILVIPFGRNITTYSRTKGTTTAATSFFRGI